ncbi:hypothetical protein B0H10DRAFT_2070560 [Mycena sp. CBHHK59/15]|nr:hypothetical protein B0H10DRAFT_2074182 [Mycena sp. CBHHK59/15]KAJ6607667.1 hypothetical protein B0H10DRAFT_2070560 [Mycena sp. CBHHK59/15]
MLRRLVSAVATAATRLSESRLFRETHFADTDPDGYHHPTPNDVFEVRKFLLHFIPAELANIIIDEARYWPRVIAQQEMHVDVSASASPGNNAFLCYLVTPPIPTVEDLESPDVAPRVKMVRFTTLSCDQGWGGLEPDRNTYNGSWTWFEAAIFRPTQPGAAQSERVWLRHALEGPVEFPRIGYRSGIEVKNLVDGESHWQVQRNVTASNLLKEHTVVWVADDLAAEPELVNNGSGDGAGFVNLLSPGDSIAVIARAQYPGWVNRVRQVDVLVYYAV